MATIMHGVRRNFKADYSQGNYKYYKNGYTKYTKSSGKTVLDANDDASTVYLDNESRMPTKKEFTELLNKCTWKWTTLNDIKGLQVTGQNGNSIFLPAAGEYNGSKNNGTSCNYWSSSLDSTYDFYASTLTGYPSGSANVSVSYRDYGFSVRSVHP